MQKKRALLCQVFAFSLHRSSLISSLTFLLPKKRFSTNKIFLILTISLLLGLTQTPFKTIGWLGQQTSLIISNPIIEKTLYYSETNLEHVSENVNPAIQTFLSITKRLIFLVFYLLVIYKNRGRLDNLTDFILSKI